jgi:hypothetical protein
MYTPSLLLPVSLYLTAPSPHLAPRPDSVWYRATDVHALTGDKVLDTLTLIAMGTRVDSLRITLTIRSRGRRIYKATWLSTWYFEYDAPIDSIPEPRKRSVVFTHLKEIFSPENYGPLDITGIAQDWSPKNEDDPRSEMAFHLSYDRALDSLRRIRIDSAEAEERARNYARQAPVDSARVRAAWAEMVHRRPVAFTYFSGGEATQTIVWSPRLGRFVVVFACC